jgi:EpsI family protein
MPNAVNLERASIAVMVPVLVAFGALSWFVQLREPLEVDARVLDEIPLQLEQWRGYDIAMDSGVEEMLAADYNLQRAYVHALGDQVWLYVGYYGTERGGRPEHTPWQCYPSNGWAIIRRDVVKTGENRANELVVERGGDRRLVHFWYQSHHKRGMLGGFDQAVERFVSRIRFGRADGSLVRLSTPIRSDEDESTARSRLRSLGRLVVAPLERYWPKEASRRSREAARVAKRS